MEKKFTKGIFSDGAIGWKIHKVGAHYNNPNLEWIEIVWSDDNECICDTVYNEADAKLIAAAPELLDKLEQSTEFLISILELFGSGMATSTRFAINMQIEQNNQAIKKALD